MSKTDVHLLCQKDCQRISVMKTNTMFPENWHFDDFVLKTTKTLVFFLITEILR